MPPLNAEARSRAAWTEAGQKYWEECKETRIRGHYKPGEHYTALPGEDRILMPNLRDLNGLRHCWCWQQRPRPHLPTWSFAKIPRLQFSPEENARLLSVYMRPWALRESESTRHNPLLSLLGKCEQTGEDVLPIFLSLPAELAGSAHDEEGPRPPKRQRGGEARKMSSPAPTQIKIKQESRNQRWGRR